MKFLTNSNFQNSYVLFKPISALKTEIDLNNVYIFRYHFTGKTMLAIARRERIIMFWEKVAVYCERETEIT